MYTFYREKIHSPVTKEPLFVCTARDDGEAWRLFAAAQRWGDHQELYRYYCEVSQ